MTLKEIYKNALALLAESLDVSDNEDYEERAPYILATLCSQLSGLDAVARRILGESAATTFNEIYLPLTSSFPLLSRFAAPAAIYLAAMLVLDDNSEFADKLYAMYSDSISSIHDSICGASAQTVNRYFVD